jgi:hypothetical protein
MRLVDIKYQSQVNNQVRTQVRSQVEDLVWDQVIYRYKDLVLKFGYLFEIRYQIKCLYQYHKD